MITWCNGYFILSTEEKRQSSCSFPFWYFNDLDIILETDDETLIKYTIMFIRKITLEMH